MNSSASLLETFKQNPFPMLLALLIGGAGLLLVIVALVVMRTKPRNAIAMGGAAAVAGLLAFAAGANGYLSLMRSADFLCGAPSVTASDCAHVRATYEAQGSYDLLFGVVAAVVPLLAGLAIVVIARGRAGRALGARPPG